MNENNRPGQIEEIAGEMPFSKREKAEDMLEQLCRWRKRGWQLSACRLSEQFGLSRREISGYLKKLLEYGYILPMEHAEEIRLTAFGIARGEELGYRHETFTQFLQLAGVSAADAQEDACRIEHVAGEKTVESICQFINSGAFSERVLHHSDLQFCFQPGTYEAGMGIYQIERVCPRRLADEYYWYEEWMTLEITPEHSLFRMKQKETDRAEKLWYMDRDAGWSRAGESEEGIEIPTEAFEFIICPSDPIIEGEILVAFVKDGDIPSEKACRELNVHISWQ